MNYGLGMNNGGLGMGFGGMGMGYGGMGMGGYGLNNNLQGGQGANTTDSFRNVYGKKNKNFIIIINLTY